MRLLIFIFTLALMLQSCIGDDIINDTVTEEFRITSNIDTLAVGDSYQLQARYTNNIGETENLPVIWSSSDDSVLSINDDGIATGLAVGAITVHAETITSDQITLRDSLQFMVGIETVTTSDERSGQIRTTSSYELTGDFVARMDGDNLIIEIADNYVASSSLPGLYVYLTNNPSTTNNAYEIGKVTVFSGSHTYTIPDVDINEYDYLLYFCKPFNVKVGDGLMSE